MALFDRSIISPSLVPLVFSTLFNVLTHPFLIGACAMAVDRERQEEIEVD